MTIQVKCFINPIVLLGPLLPMCLLTQENIRAWLVDCGRRDPSGGREGAAELYSPRKEAAWHMLISFFFIDSPHIRKTNKHNQALE